MAKTYRTKAVLVLHIHVVTPVTISYLIMTAYSEIKVVTYVLIYGVDVPRNKLVSLYLIFV